MGKNKKIIVVLLIISIIIVMIIYMLMIMSKKNIEPLPLPLPLPSIPIEASVEIPDKTLQVVENDLDTQSTSITKPTKEEEEDFAAINRIAGKVISAETGSIKILTTEGELTLKIPQSGAFFTKQIKQEDGSFLVEEMGVSDIQKDKEVFVQYNSKTNEVMLVVIK